jgi:hypothetical protein
VEYFLFYPKNRNSQLLELYAQEGGLNPKISDNAMGKNATVSR